MGVKDGKAVEYCRWCLEAGNQKVPNYVKLQAMQWMDVVNGRDPDAEVDERQYEKICKLLKIMVHPDLHCSLYEGLEDYAWLLITATFCTVCHDGSRYYETAVLEIARKNFKTFNSAIIFILMMLTEPRFSRFFSVAPDLRLSNELKLAIRKIIKSSPILADEKVFKILRSEIRCNVTDSDYTPLAYSQDRMDGNLATGYLADEAGALDEYPIEAMRSSQITLRTKLGIIISTQYPNDNNAMIDEIDISKKTLDGLMDDRRRFSLLYEPDAEYHIGEQWKTNDNIIYQSNPAAVKNKTMLAAIQKMRRYAVLYENKRENYLCKHNNIKYKSLGVESYVEIDKVKACSIPEDLEFWRGQNVFVGLDLAQTEDNVAIAMLTQQDGVVYAKAWGFIPAEAVKRKSKKEGVDYERLIRRGNCYACGEEVIDYSVVERFVMGLKKKYGVNILQCGYDRWNALSTVQKLEANVDENGRPDGIECVEVKQHSSVLHMPTKLLKEKILSKQFRYDANQMLEINFQNARCTEDTNLNKYVNKRRSEGKVDMVMAILDALYLQQQSDLFGKDEFFIQC